MRRMPALMLLVASAVLAAEPKVPKTLDVPAEKTAGVKALIAKLDDDDILARDKITAELKTMGREALPALLEAQKGKLPDRVLDRVLEILPTARKADFDARAAAFLTDKDRKFDHDLPGWNELKAAVKDTKESRLLFADMLDDDSCREMLLLALDTTEDGQKRFEKRWENKLKEWQAVSRAEVRAGLKTNGSWPKANAPIQWMPAALLADLLYGRDYRSYYRQFVVQCFIVHTDEGKLALAGKGKYGEAVRGLASYWIARQQERFGLEDARAIADHLKFDKAVVHETVEKLFEVLVTSGQGINSLDQLAGTRDPKYIASFRRLFDIDKPYWEARADSKLPEIQLRDAGLSMCIALSGQDPIEYGFTTQLKTKATDNMRYYPSNYYFADGDGKTADDKRKAAFKKWAEWEKANPDKLKAKVPDKK